jgi:hypothetical protein
MYTRTRVRRYYSEVCTSFQIHMADSRIIPVRLQASPSPRRRHPTRSINFLTYGNGARSLLSGLHNSGKSSSSSFVHPYHPFPRLNLNLINPLRTHLRYLRSSQVNSNTPVSARPFHSSLRRSVLAPSLAA